MILPETNLELFNHDDFCYMNIGNSTFDWIYTNSDFPYALFYDISNDLLKYSNDKRCGYVINRKHSLNYKKIK